MTIKANTVNNLVITRFAPSPTGFMHIGNARTALFSYLFAKKNQGEFLLRIEDTDQQRSKPEYTKTILEDLTKLGLIWDKEVVYQSKRTSIYQKFYQKLLEQGLMYRCFCSEEKLNFIRKSQLNKGLAPRYDGCCLRLSTAEVDNKIANHEQFCWRFKVPQQIKINFCDLIKGPQQFNSDDFGDFVILRQNGAPSFMFSSAIDDALQQITHVLRGEDHVSNTPRQILILQALGLNIPEYGHFCLLATMSKDQDKLEKLSKRGGSQSINDLLSMGYLPEALLNYLSRLGHSYAHQDNQLFSLEQLAWQFDLNHTTSNIAKHDMQHLKFWQKQAMLQINDQQLLQLLNGNSRINRILINNNLVNDNLEDCKQCSDLLDLIRSNTLMPQEAEDWVNILFVSNVPQLNPYISNSNLDDFSNLNNFLQNIDLKLLKTLISIKDQLEFKDLVAGLKQQGFTSKQIYSNLRMILTGKDSGPELNKIFAIMGNARIKDRAYEIMRLIKKR